MNHVLIVTYGRSGSTLLQGILNAIDGWLVRGENFNFVFGLFQSYEALAKAKGTFGNEATDPTFPWYGSDAINLKNYRTGVRQLIDSVLLGNRDANTVTCCGFKEIRYLELLSDNASGKTLAAYLDFLNACLSPCKTVFLSRDHDETSRSGWWPDQPKQVVLEQLAAFDRFSDQHCIGREQCCFQISYADIVAQSDRLAGLFGFLGAAPAADRVKAILETPHSYDPRVTNASSASLRTTPKEGS